LCECCHHHHHYYYYYFYYYLLLPPPPFLLQIGSFFGGWLAGYLFDAHLSYTPMWIISIVLSVVAAALVLPVKEVPVLPEGIGPRGISVTPAGEKDDDVEHTHILKGEESKERENEEEGRTTVEMVVASAAGRHG